jgi:two-component system response regulator HydG
MDRCLLIVEDDEDQRELLAELLVGRGFRVMTAQNGATALEKIAGADLDAVIIDLQLPDFDGVSLGTRILENRDVAVIILTGQGSIDAAINAVRAGLDDFLRKPSQIDELVFVLERAIERRELHREVKRLRDASAGSESIDDMIGNSRPMERLQDLVKRVAGAEVSVLITGESGTGKELVARAIHARSPRRDGPFIAINCAAMPSALLESELFGHTRGAFTDAKANKTGLLVQASGGTVFLDEIGDMPAEMQAKLLRALQERSVRPVGGEREVPIDARIIAATNRDLEQDIEDGRFREDLFYRINVVHVPVPPLRSRSSDILVLAQHFITKAASRSNRAVRGLSAAAAQKLQSYDWPGNIRELENAIERAVVLAQFDELTPNDFPDKITKYEAKVELPADDREILTVEEMERRHIVHVMNKVEGNKTRAAKLLGFDRRTLYRKLERYGLGS